MKLEDAIKQLKSIQCEAHSQAESCHRDGEYDTVWDKDVEALDMAIGALIAMDALEELSKGQAYVPITIIKMQD